MAIQENLGADIAMVLDECPPPRTRVQRAGAAPHAPLGRTLPDSPHPSDQALFGIVQGGIFPDLREQSARFLIDLDFPGYAIGGLAVGETKDQMHSVLDLTDRCCPKTSRAI